MFATSMTFMEFKRSKFSRKVRKKKRLGEFRVYGFCMDVYCESDPNGLIIDLVLDLIISKGIYLSGGGDRDKYSFFIEGIKKEEDRDFVVEGVKKIEGVSKVVDYPIVDVWHDNADLYFDNIDKIREENGQEK